MARCPRSVPGKRDALTGTVASRVVRSLGVRTKCSTSLAPPRQTAPPMQKFGPYFRRLSLRLRPGGINMASTHCERRVTRRRAAALLQGGPGAFGSPDRAPSHRALQLAPILVRFFASNRIFQHAAISGTDSCPKLCKLPRPMGRSSFWGSRGTRASLKGHICRRTAKPRRRGLKRPTRLSASACRPRPPLAVLQKFTNPVPPTTLDLL